jgi:ABC-2 type transport system permease protein
VNDLGATATLWRRELQRFYRQPSRVAGAVAMPVILWILLGTGLSSSFRLPGGEAGTSYLEYFFPGTVVLLVLFAAIFSTFSLIEDRHEGFLQGVLVAPVSRGAIVSGKVLGGASLAWFQGALILVLAPMAGISPTPVSLIKSLAILGLLAVALTSTGFAFAWKIDSTQGYHAVMNVLLIPMWFLSGAFFPSSNSPAWLSWAMRLNPLTYGTAAFRRALYGQRLSAGGDLPSLQTGLVVLVLWCFVALVADVFLLQRSAAR